MSENRLIRGLCWFIVFLAIVNAAIGNVAFGVLTLAGLVLIVFFFA